MNIKKKYTVIILILIFCMLVFAALVSPVFEIDEIQVIGNSQLSNEEIFSIAGIDKVGGNIFAFNSGTAKKRLSKSNYIKSVRIVKNFPSTIIINIEERKVRGYIPYLGKYLFIDVDGRVIDISDQMPISHPIILGLKFSGFTLGEPLTVTNDYSLSDVVQISKLIDAYDLADMVIKVDVSKPEDIHLYVNQIDVTFGSIDDAYTKIATLNEIVKQLDPQEAGTLDISDITVNPSFKLLT